MTTKARVLLFVIFLNSAAIPGTSFIRPLVYSTPNEGNFIGVCSDKAVALFSEASQQTQITPLPSGFSPFMKRPERVWIPIGNTPFAISSPGSRRKLWNAWIAGMRNDRPCMLRLAPGQTGCDFILIEPGSCIGSSQNLGLWVVQGGRSSIYGMEDSALKDTQPARAMPMNYSRDCRIYFDASGTAVVVQDERSSRQIKFNDPACNAETCYSIDLLQDFVVIHYHTGNLGLKLAHLPL
jgi:hypothetical protein